MPKRLLLACLLCLFAYILHAQSSVLVIRKNKTLITKSEPRHLEPVQFYNYSWGSMWWDRCGGSGDGGGSLNISARAGIQHFTNTFVELGIHSESYQSRYSQDVKLEYNAENKVYGLGLLNQWRINRLGPMWINNNVIIAAGFGISGYKSEAGINVLAYPCLSVRPVQGLASVFELSYAYAFSVFEIKEPGDKLPFINPNHRITLSMDLISM